MKEQTARLPLRLPSRPLDAAEFDDRLLKGDRRQGFVLYRPSCPGCSACEPIRLSSQSYRPSKTQRRISRLGDKLLTMQIGAPKVDGRRVRLYNEHKSARNLRDGQPPIDEDGYRDFLVATCCETFELSFYLSETLVGIAICDRSQSAISAVYCCYDPNFSRLSIGTYSILKQLDLCRRWGLKYVYLGLYISGCQSMEYKARYLPHERLIDNRWQQFG